VIENRACLVKDCLRNKSTQGVTMYTTANAMRKPQGKDEENMRQDKNRKETHIDKNNSP
jgi:hypothetical protein